MTEVNRAKRRFPVSPQIQRFLRSEPNAIRKMQEGLFLVLFVDCDFVHAHNCRCESVREPQTISNDIVYCGVPSSL